MDLLASALEKADYATVFDNSEKVPRPIARKTEDTLKLLIEAKDFPWVNEKLMAPYIQRLFSRKFLTDTFSGGRPVHIAEAAHGNNYHGVVMGVTDYHILQRVDDKLLLHDRQLTATMVFTPNPNQKQTINYRYQYGKIVEVKQNQSICS